MKSETIQTLLEARFSPLYLTVTDESHQHRTHAGAETHFNVVLVSDVFIGLSRVQRHQAVYACLNQIEYHALALHLFTPEEWETKGKQAFDSPKCRGGGKK